jgi:uncharacterized protein YkwD
MIFRAGSMHCFVLAALFCCVLGVNSGEARETYAAFAQRLTETADQNVRFRPDLEQAVVSAVNQYRRSKGKKPLQHTDTHRLAARAHAKDMALNGFVGHRSSTGQGFDSRMRALNDGAMFLPSMGENAARVSSSEPADQAKAMKLVKQWIESSSHRRAMTSATYTSTSMGVVQIGAKLYAVQIFSGPPVKTNAPIKRSSSAARDTKGLY